MRTLYYNARVYTGAQTLDEAFLVEDGRFLAVGAEAQMRSLADADTACVDLAGGFVSPGFNDSHMHLVGLGHVLDSAQLDRHTGSLAELLRYLAAYAAEHPPREGRWLFGRGWNQDYFSDVTRLPNRADLDAVSTDYPIQIMRACGHCCVVNSRALELAGITADTPAPAGGAVGMENGQPDGRLYDNAMDLLTPVLPPPDKEELKQMIRLACGVLNSYGVTSAQTDDYCTFRAVDWETYNAAYRELEASGELTVRVNQQANFTTLPALRRFVEEAERGGPGSLLYKIGPLKMLGDGALGARTAHLSRPYADRPDTCGFSLYSAEHLNKMVSYANARGMQVAIHAIGDACLDRVLDAVELALNEHPRADHRHGVVHCQISRPDQLERMRRLNMHIYAQSVFLDYDNHIVQSRVGPELAATSYSWKTLMDGGLSVSNGSDCPVELPDVMRGVECAVTRRSLDGTGPYLPGEAFTVREALDSYTIRGAEASFEEGFKGRIAPGYLADFTVLERDPFETEPRALHEIRVLSTWLGGRLVYQA